MDNYSLLHSRLLIACVWATLTENCHVHVLDDLSELVVCAAALLLPVISGFGGSSEDVFAQLLCEAHLYNSE